jgi:HPt (histidine-containing phosphotransfer) domain-containing protein
MTLDEQKSTPDLITILNQLWARFLPDIYERVAILETATQACAAGQITREQREAAQAAAHKLAGSLGTFDLGRGSELAREFEMLCASEDFCTATQVQQLTALAAEIRSVIDSRK